MTNPMVLAHGPGPEGQTCGRCGTEIPEGIVCDDCVYEMLADAREENEADYRRRCAEIEQ